MRVWQVQEAKNRFSEVVEEAVRGEPQVITRRGVETAVVLSYADYCAMLLRPKTLSEFLAQSPLVGVDLDLSRDESRSGRRGGSEPVDSMKPAAPRAG